jgi:hypothetical protein
MENEFHKVKSFQEAINNCEKAQDINHKATTRIEFLEKKIEKELNLKEEQKDELKNFLEEGYSDSAWESYEKVILRIETLNKRREKLFKIWEDVAEHIGETFDTQLKTGREWKESVKYMQTITKDKMKKELKEIHVKELVEGYKNNDEEGVVGYSGKLNIRPKYQREFIYKDKNKIEVIKSIIEEFPLGLMYWSKDTDDTYAVMDGQQRIISICEYVIGNYSVNGMYFHNLTEEEQEQILDYKLLVYICEGTEREKLKWFNRINTVGEKLTEQELLNAVYTGTWLTDAKKHFSKTGCVAYSVGQDYLKGIPIRQDYLETIIKWKSNNNITHYMAIHQHDKDANELWVYFQNVMNWVKVTFPNYRKEMKGIDWGFLYNQFNNKYFNSDSLEKEIVRLMQDEDVTKKSGVYSYLIDGQEKHLSIRAFNDNIKREVFILQGGHCSCCEKPFKIEEMEADHITPWHEGGKTVTESCPMLYRNCNRTKSDK